jgi:hypothetical protein
MFTAIVLNAFSIMFPAAAAASHISIEIEFDQYFDRILPTQRLTVTHYQMEAALSSNGNISHQEHKTNSSGVIFQFQKIFRIGRNDKVEWRVVNKDTLINVFEYKSFKRAILLTVKDGACSAQVDFQLKPGFTDYQYRSQPSKLPAVARSVRADHFQCKIKDIQGA